MKLAMEMGFEDTVRYGGEDEKEQHIIQHNGLRA